MASSAHVIGYMKDFLFQPEQARTPISNLSGGERGRLMLARICRSPSNLLILDEPTNDLDIETLDLLQEMSAGLSRHGDSGQPRPRFPRPHRDLDDRSAFRMRPMGAGSNMRAAIPTCSRSARALGRAQKSAEKAARRSRGRSDAATQPPEAPKKASSPSSRSSRSTTLPKADGEGRSRNRHAAKRRWPSPISSARDPASFGQLASARWK